MNAYTPKVDDVIWSLYSEGWKPGQIRHALEHDEELADELGEPVKMPARTMSEKLKRLREERGEPTPCGIRPGEELDAIQVVRRKTLAWAKAHLRRLTDKEVPDEKEIKHVGQLMAIVDRTETHLRESRRHKDPQAQDAARQRHRLSPGRPVLREIAEQESRREAAEAEEARAGAEEAQNNARTPEPVGG